jgi:hypothetical protein
MQSHKTFPFGVQTTSARWPIAKAGCVPMPITPGSYSRYELKCPAASAANVVQVCPRGGTYCRSSSQMRHSSGAARRILGAAGGANKRVHLTAPGICSLPLVIRHPARTSAPKLPLGRNLKCQIREAAKIWPFKEDLRAGRATIDRPRPGRRSTIRQPYIRGEVFASSVPRRQYSKLSGVHQSEVFAARRLCARRKRPNQLREHSDSRSRIAFMRTPALARARGRDTRARWALGVMAVTKCRIWAPSVNPFTAPPRALSQCGRTGDGWSALLEWRRS